MSVVAVKVGSDRIRIAADSILIKEDLKKTNFKKLCKFKDIIVAGCGSAEELSLFFKFAEDFSPVSCDINSIRHYMQRFSNVLEDYYNVRKINNDYIIIYEGHVYEVEGMFVQEITDYTAIGEGEAYALAALHLGHDVVDAVQVACKFSCFVSEPVIVEEVAI